MEKRRLYPVGIQDFEVVRNRSMVYVDKTAYIYRMVYGGAQTVFLCRPRRFGKTLLCNTLKHYFLGHRDLFKGLAIDRLETEWIVYPVLHFDNCLMQLLVNDNPQANSEVLVDPVRRAITEWRVASNLNTLSTQYETT